MLLSLVQVKSKRGVVEEIEISARKVLKTLSGSLSLKISWFAPRREVTKMATYCVEKFESSTGREQRVYWDCNKHVHNAAMLTSVKQKLQNRYGGTWDVRAGSYQPNQSKVPDNAVALSDL